jgi:hypothetical protein
MKLQAHLRDPIDDTSTSFASATDAQRFLELVTRYFLTFKEIHMAMMAVLKQQPGWNVYEEMQEMAEELDRFERLLNLKLPPKAAAEIIARSIECLKRLAELFPEQRAQIEVTVAETQGVVMALLEKQERKQEQRALQ